jgi:hypothetical protein
MGLSHKFDYFFKQGNSLNLAGYFFAVFIREASGSTLPLHLNYFCLLTWRARFSRREEEEEEDKN